MTIKEVIKYEIIRNRNISVLAFLSIMIGNPSKRVIFIYRVAKMLHDKGYTKTGILLRNRLITKYGVHISLKAQIGLGFVIKHANGVVIGDGVVVGKNVVVYQQVTLGGKNVGEGLYPKIEDGVVIFAGAKIVGDVLIKSNSIIGANSVVVKDVEADCVYGGIPAKKIKKIN